MSGAGGGGESLEEIFPGPQSRHWRMPLASGMRIRSEGLGFREAAGQLLQAPGIGGAERDAGQVARVYLSPFSSGFSSQGRCSIS